MISARKLTLLTSSSGPVFRSRFTTREQQCAYLNSLVANNKRKLTVDQLLRWRRVGVRRTKLTDNLHAFAEAVGIELQSAATAKDIAGWIVDDQLTVADFSARFNISQVDLAFLTAQFEFERSGMFFSESKFMRVSARSEGGRSNAHGIYEMTRRGSGRGRSSSKCILTIDRIVEINDDHGYVFSQLFVPQPRLPQGYTEYRGFMLQPANHKYFFFESVDADIEDFVSIITDVGTVPPTSLVGTYLSANIEGLPAPDVRKAELNKIFDDVTDINLEKSINSICSKK